MIVGTDPLASKNLLERLATMFSLEYTYEKLDKIIEEAEAKNALLSQAEEAEEGTEEDSTRGGPSYYI